MEIPIVLIFLLNEAGEMSLIDWEYSGMGEPAGDLGTFIACSNYTVEGC